MKTLYIGGQKSSKQGGIKWKLYFYLSLSLLIIGTVLNFTGSIIVEKWINKQGSGDSGYAFSIRDVELSLGRGQVTLNDVKVFNPKTSTELLEAPELIIQINWSDLLLYQDKIVTLKADQVDLSISKDFASEIARIQSDKKTNDLFLDSVEGKFSKLNIIEKKEGQTRTLLALNDVNVKVKEVGLLSINKKTEFTVTSSVADGGKLNLTGKTIVEEGTTPWTIHGTLKQVPSDIFNKIAGDKLPFVFRESRLNAEINAHSEHGKVSGEFSPEIKILNVVTEKPGVPTQSIARALNDDLTFTLPFTLKDEWSFQYGETYTRLKNYRKYPAATETPALTQTQAMKAPKTAKTKKSFSFWPF